MHPLSEAPMRIGALCVIPFYILLIIGVMLPSDGSHGLLAPKSLAFLTASFSALIYLISTHNLYLKQIKTVTFFFGFICFLILWFWINLIYEKTPVESGIDQFKLFLLTCTVIALTYYFFTEKILKFNTFLKTIIYANFCYSLLKVSLVALHILKVINMWSILEKLGIRFISMAILTGLDRLQTSVDIVTPFLFYFFLQSNHLGVHFSKKFRFFYVIISIVAVFLSFSRFLMGVVVFGVIFYALSGKVSTAIRSFTVICLFLLIAVFSIGIENSAMIVERRLFSSDNYVSDQTRQEQIDIMLVEHESYPIFGKGLGGFAESLIRDPLIRHSYEVQWMAFLMQFGFIGICLLLVPIGIITFTILSPPISRQKIALFLMFGLWLFSGFTNPFLISLASGIMYSLFLVSGKTLNEREKYA